MSNMKEAYSEVRQDPMLTAIEGGDKNARRHLAPVGQVLYRVEAINQTGQTLTVTDEHGISYDVPSNITNNPSYAGKLVIRKTFTEIRKSTQYLHIFNDMYNKVRETPVRKVIRKFYERHMAVRPEYTPVPTWIEGPIVEIVIEPDPITGYDRPLFCVKSKMLVVKKSEYSHRHLNPNQSTTRINTFRSTFTIVGKRYKVLANQIKPYSIGMLLEIVDNNKTMSGRYVNLMGRPFYCKAVRDESRESGAYFTQTNSDDLSGRDTEVYPNFVPLAELTAENGFYADADQARAMGDTKLRTAMLEEAKQRRALEEAERVRQYEDRKRDREARELEQKREREAKEQQAKLAREAEELQARLAREANDRAYEQQKREQEQQALREAREHDIRMQKAKEEAAKKEADYKESLRQAAIHDKSYDRQMQAEKHAKEERLSKRKNFTDTIKYFVELVGSATGLFKLVGMFTKWFAPA